MTGFEQWDRLLTLWINHPAGSSMLLDKIVSDIAASELLKGGLFMPFTGGCGSRDASADAISWSPWWPPWPR